MVFAQRQPNIMKCLRRIVLLVACLMPVGASVTGSVLALTPKYAAGLLIAGAAEERDAAPAHAYAGDDCVDAMPPKVRMDAGGKTLRISLRCYFAETGLTFTASTNATGSIVTTQDSLVITSGYTPGEAQITVTGTDGLSTRTKVFHVKVTSCIEPEDSIAAQTVSVTSPTARVNVSGYFTITDADYSGATTTYTARTEPESVVSGSISGSMLTLTKVATTSSSATVILRASATRTGETSAGCTAEQRFAARVKTPVRANDQNPVRDTSMVVVIRPYTSTWRRISWRTTATGLGITAFPSVTT